MTSDPAASRWRGAVARLTEVTPQSATTPTAVRAGLSIAVPLLLLWAAGRPEWSLYATFGAFTAVYARGVTRTARVRTQAAVGLVLTAAVASGAAVALSADRAWLAVPVTALWASAAARASDRFRWRPPGPMFAVFAVAACAAVPLGAPSVVVSATAVAAGTAAFAVLLAALEPARFGAPASGPAPADPPLHRQRIHAVRCAVAVLLAGGLATATGIGHPYWAMATAVVPLATVTLRRQVVRGVHRVLGTVVGLGVAALLLALPLTPIVTILVAAGLQLITELLVARHYGAALVTITPLALLLVDLARPEPIGQLLVDRALETLLGVAVGVLVALVTRDRRTGRHTTSAGGPRPDTDPGGAG
ncbi:Fusaric acid resistance protein-like [Geodermatophilus siccatus]|uniref:Fusaric acid resistance protein-like n=1 Tax=Geodermatophilus siccatus TaxID=1137991 RepID=A0A1G9QK94_9ACTN|nr:FUSC family protein [Geodermatophilus siccatus]SDM11418.1 Fusaric acid resistance protein-like [Geodermatophilus siccatus]